jgi:1-deoxy-D-xylulose-5-phosphate synthase
VSGILETVASPADLKRMSVPELSRLADELRAFIIESVSRTGGHLAANLGVVELTVGLLKVFDPPADKLVWDTGHQCYPYKILTGRRDRFHTLRQFGGISGFPRREESPCDAFGVGHAGTALSAALGMAVARDRRGSKEHVVAVVGDAAAGCGISLEALNNLDGTTRRLIVILNDNAMSISRNVGSISRYLGGLLANPRYNRWKRSVENVATRLRLGPLRSAYYRVEEALKSLFLGSVIFEEFGLRYVGPIDGHDLGKLVDALTIARASDRPVLLHVWTRKGKGYPLAEQQPARWHGTICFDVASGEAPGGGRPSYSSVFGAALVRLAEADPRVCAITAGMCINTGLSDFASRFPERFFDVGISEEHAAVFAAGLAAEGMRPFLPVYSTFSQRIVDCVIHDICLQNLPVTLCLDRAGIVGDDGPTHQGLLDIALLRPVPNLLQMQPADEAELAGMLRACLDHPGPACVRYPRGSGPGATVPEHPAPMPIGRAAVLREGADVQCWALGDFIPLALRVAERLAGAGVSAGVVNARFVRPLDTELLAAQAPRARLIATFENGVLQGGFGAEVRDRLAAIGYRGRVHVVGWPSAFIEHGAPDLLMGRHGLTEEAIAAAILAALEAGGA